MVFQRLRAAAVALAVVAMVQSGPALADDNFRAILEADAAKIDTALALEGDEAAKIDEILAAGVAQRLDILDKAGIVYGGEAPGYATLLAVQVQMDALRAKEREQLAVLLTEEQMKTVDELGKAAEQEFKDIVLGGAT